MKGLCLIVLGTLISNSVNGDRHGHVVDDKPSAHALYQRADQDADGQLTKMELHLIFWSFDLDANQVVSADEFRIDWTVRQFGNDADAMTVFHHLDVNNDNELTEDVDLDWMFYFFDRDANNYIDETEFVTLWAKMAATT